MRGFVLGLLLGTAVTASAEGVSQELRLKVQLQKLYTQVVQLSQQLNACQLATSQNVIEAEVRKALDAKPDDVIDWDTVTIKPKPAQDLHTP